jgi:cytochrome P450
MYERDGWTPVPTLTGLDDPHHRTIRGLYDEAFRPARISGLDPYVEELANRLIDDFLAAGRCDWVAQFAVPLPLYVIGRQAGIPEADMPQIKIWTDAWVKRMGLMLTPDERRWSAAQEIEAQHYFQARFDALRAEPDDTLLSELVNTTVAEWGRKLNDNELHSEMMADLFVGGAETTTSALAAGVALLIENPAIWERLKADPEGQLEPFIEEVLRVESPVQGLLREAAEEFELHGVRIPAGATICLRYGAANRDERRYPRATEIDLERPRNRSHLAFGVGTHHCLGAPLARRELFFGFKALLERCREIRLVPDANDFRIAPNFFLRGLESLQIEFEPAEG